MIVGVYEGVTEAENERVCVREGMLAELHCSAIATGSPFVKAAAGRG